ncbi:MAG: hypothetical protein ACK5MJ_08230 [Alphaproteobacteria bacterium]
MDIQNNNEKNTANLENISKEEQLIKRLETAVDKLIKEQHQQKKEIDDLNGRTQILEEELNKARLLQENVEKRIFGLIERLRNLVEEDDR